MSKAIDELRKNMFQTEIEDCVPLADAERIITAQEQRLDLLVTECADACQWEDRSYLHAVEHIKNAIFNRDATIKQQEQRIAELEAEIEAACADCCEDCNSGQYRAPAIRRNKIWVHDYNSGIVNRCKARLIRERAYQREESK